MHEIEVWIMTDANGDHACSISQEDVEESFSNNIGTPTYPVRIDCINVSIELPVAGNMSLSLPLSKAAEVKAAE